MIYRIEDGVEMTASVLSEYIAQHETEVTTRLGKLREMYVGEYEIFKIERKPDWKPDNRLGVNFAKYIVDTFSGFFAGNPVKTTYNGENSAVTDYLQKFQAYNSEDNENAELARISSIFGRAYEMLYIDEHGEICMTYLDPIESFMIVDDSVLARPKYFVRTYKNADGNLTGSVSDANVVRWFEYDPILKWVGDEQPHGFDGVPAIEYVENDDDIGTYEGCVSLIDAYNKCLSEQANDIDYFGDAYMKILGATLDEETIRQLRQNRIINFDGSYDANLVVEFMSKPDGCQTQTAFLDRLEALIYQTSMVPNLSDENFGNASGISLKYKMMGMNNLARTKERKFVAGFEKRYRLVFSSPVCPVAEDEWTKLEYTFTPNMPNNVLEEAQTAAQLAGIVSRETQLKLVSVVDDVDMELQKIREDSDPLTYATDFPTER